MWHAAAVVTSNGTAALLAAGEDILRAIGVVDAETVLGPLALGTMKNAIEGGGGGATLTGPVVRGDVDTVLLHIAALRDRDPELAQTYVTISAAILEAAVRSGRIDDRTAAAMRDVLVWK
jgi:predicted short-subunit dehydrogenase-like oxidoreductase (DUF2520 family)